MRILTNKNLDFLKRYHKNMFLERHKLAYLAGLVDGEGYIKIEKWGTVRLVIGMTDYKTIKWIYDNYGGAFYKDQTLKSGKKFYVWRLGDAFSTLYLMIMLYPFLITKKHRLFDAINLTVKRLKKHQAFSILKGFDINVLNSKTKKKRG